MPYNIYEKKRIKNTLTNKDKESIIDHFAYRLKIRYGIEGDKYQLQQTFIKHTQKGVKLMNYRNDRNKGLYVTRYKGIRVLFVYNREIKLCKTALTLK